MLFLEAASPKCSRVHEHGAKAKENLTTGECVKPFPLSKIQPQIRNDSYLSPFQWRIGNEVNDLTMADFPMNFTGFAIKQMNGHLMSYFTRADASVIGQPDAAKSAERPAPSVECEIAPGQKNGQKGFTELIVGH